MSNSQQVIPISLGYVKAFLIKGKGAVLVDTGVPGSFDKIIDALKQNGVEPPNVSLIILTHNHIDHVGEVYRLKQFTGAKVAVHESEAKALREGRNTEVVAAGGLLSKILVKMVKNSELKGVEADVLIKDELDLGEYGIEGKVIHTPGHTPGSVAVALADGEIIFGDTIIGKTNEKAAKPLFASDLKELKNSVNKIAKMLPRVIHNSHGVPCSTKAIEGLYQKL